MSSLGEHRLVTEASERFRPFFNVDLMAYLSNWTKEIKNYPEGAEQMYQDMLSAVEKVIQRCKSLGVTTPVGRKTTYSERVEQINKNVTEKKDYVTGANLLLREAARIMCSMRAGLPQVTRVDTDRAVELLHQSFKILMNDSVERKIVDSSNQKIQIGIGNWGEVFFEKHQGDAIEIYLYSGVFSDLFCSFLNAHVVDGGPDSDAMLFNLLEFSSIHPCAENSPSFSVVVEDILVSKKTK